MTNHPDYPKHLWDIKTFSGPNVLGHVEIDPGMVAWLGEQAASLNRQIADLKITIQELEDNAFLRAKNIVLTRSKKVKGGVKEESFTPSDDVAKIMARTDEEVLAYKRALNDLTERRDKAQGYLKALEQKQVLLAPVVGIHRDELRSNSGNTR